jgi:hypothetical protein
MCSVSSGATCLVRHIGVGLGLVRLIPECTVCHLVQCLCALSRTHTKHTRTLTHTHTHTHTALEVVGVNAAYLHYTYACSAYSSAFDATSIHHSAPYAGARRPKGQAVLKEP